MLTETKIHRLFCLIPFLSNSYHKTREDCISFPEIGDTAFYSYLGSKTPNCTTLELKPDKGFIVDFIDPPPNRCLATRNKSLQTYCFLNYLRSKLNC